MSREEGNVRLDIDKVSNTSQSSRVITSPRLRASSFMAKAEMRKQIQAKQSQQIAELTKLDSELSAAISFAKHNSKSAKELASKMSEASAKMFQQLSVDDLLGMNDIQRERLDLSIDVSKKYSDPNFYTAYIEHMANAIKSNWKIFEDEQYKNNPSIIGSKQEIFEGLHFWHEVLQELRQQGDDFSAAIIINVLASRYGKFQLLKDVNKDISEYLKKFTNDFALFSTEYQKDKNKIENIKNQNTLIDACFKAELTIPSSQILFQLMKYYKVNEQQDKKQENKQYRDDILQYQLLTLQAKYFDYLIENHKEKMNVANKTKNTEDHEDNLRVMSDIQDKALNVADERLKNWGELIKTSNHEELIRRYNEKFILLEMKDKLIDNQKVNLTAMRLMHMTSKEPLTNLPTMEKINNSQQKMVKDKKEIIEDRLKLKDELKIISDVSKFVDKIEKFRALHHNDKTLSEVDHENHFQELKTQLLNFQESINKKEFKENHDLLSESVDRVMNELLHKLENNFNHAKVQILSRPGLMQNEIIKLQSEYQLHMSNMKNDNASLPEAIKGVQAVRTRVEKLLEITNDANFLLKSEVKNLQEQLTSLKSNLPQNQINHIVTAASQEVTVQNSPRPGPS